MSVLQVRESSVGYRFQPVVPQGEMIVKKKLALPLALLMFMGVSLYANPQNPAPEPKSVSADQLTDDTIQMMRQDIRSKKKQLVAANMTLSDTEATKFWPAYDRYTAETVKLNDVRYALIKEYAQNYSNMSEEQARGYITRWLQADENMTKLRIKWIPE